VHFFAECPALGKAIFAECLTLPRAALGKELLCRVSDIWHSTKHMTLGKDIVSGSEIDVSFLFESYLEDQLE
jgi:hypothetical protein